MGFTPLYLKFINYPNQAIFPVELTGSKTLPTLYSTEIVSKKSHLIFNLYLFMVSFCSYLWSIFNLYFGLSLLIWQVYIRWT